MTSAKHRTGTEPGACLTCQRLGPFVDGIMTCPGCGRVWRLLANLDIVLERETAKCPTCGGVGYVILPPSEATERGE